MIDCRKIPNLIENLNFMAQYSTHGVVVLDLEGKILMDNESACKLMGYDSLTGMNFRDIAPPPYKILFNPKYMQRGYGSESGRFVRRDGSMVYMAAQGVVLKDDKGQPWGVYIYIYDCTTERELRAEVDYLTDKMRCVMSSIQQIMSKEKSLPPEITPAEREIAALVKKGLSCKEIAAMRNVGVKSVENVRVSLRKKLGVNRRANLQVALQDYGEL